MARLRALLAQASRAPRTPLTVAVCTAAAPATPPKAHLAIGRSPGGPLEVVVDPGDKVVLLDLGARACPGDVCRLPAGLWGGVPPTIDLLGAPADHLGDQAGCGALPVVSEERRSK